jgi:hypothetical protein
MSFSEKLRLLLDPAVPDLGSNWTFFLPHHIDLGYKSCSWENGEFIWGSTPPDFRRLTRKELTTLLHRLRAAPHVTLLNLYGHDIDEAMMKEMAASIATLNNLKVLVLFGTCQHGTPCPPPNCWIGLWPSSS